MAVVQLTLTQILGKRKCFAVSDIKAWFKKRFGRGSSKKKHDDEEDPEIKEKELKADRNLSKSFHEHQLTAEELSEQFPDSGIDVDEPKNSTGLSSSAAAEKLKKDGPNALKPPEEKSDWMLLLEQFLNLFWLLMIGAGILSLITYILDRTAPLNLYVALVLFSVTIIMCLISFWEEKKARQVRN
jgi:magnesium-transporting ATPase (P-type)